jgi:diguanylate cyclase (GGDEF)-like protein/PAS domain S-box-containing protein
MALQHPETRLESMDDLSLVWEHDRQVSTRLEQEHLNYRGIFEGIADAVVVTDATFSIVDANPAFTLMSGRTLEEVRGKPVADFVPEQDHARLAGDLRRYVDTGGHESDFPFLHKDGSVRQWHFSGHRTSPSRYVNIIRDVTEQQRSEQLLQLMAYTDPLTGLANRISFQQQLERAVADAVSGGYAAGVLILGLGNFREINDTLGAAGGDQLLCEAAARLQAAVAGTGIVSARFGAAQFGVLLARLDGAQHLERAARALIEVLAAPIMVDGIPVEVTPCLGAAHCPNDALLGGELLRRASVAQHHARALQVPYVSYSTELDPFSLERLTLVAELRQAVARDQLELWYQPKLDLRLARRSG